MRKIDIILFCLFMCPDMRAQVRGVVVDLETHVPIRDVAISLNTNNATRTKWDGSFIINNDFGSATFTRSGYLSRNMNKEEIKDTVFLLPSGRTLAEVVVYARKPGPKFDYGGMTALDRKLINNQAAAQGGFNLLGFASLALKSLKNKRKTTKQQDLKKKLDSY